MIYIFPPLRAKDREIGLDLMRKLATAKNGDMIEAETIEEYELSKKIVFIPTEESSFERAVHNICGAL